MRRLPSRWCRFSIVGLLVALGSIGCGGPNKVAAGAPHIPFNALSQAQYSEQLMSLGEQPVVIHFKVGQEVPLAFLMDSRLLTIAPQDLKLRVKSDFFLLLRADGPPLLSEDGVEFEEEPINTFTVEFDTPKADQPAKMKLRLSLRSEQ